MSQIDAKNEAAAIQATARAIVRVTTRQVLPKGAQAPHWAMVHATVMVAHLRADGFVMSPCEPDAKALENPLYSIATGT